MKKIYLLIFALFLCVSAIFLGNIQDSSAELNTLFDDFFRDYLELNPNTGTILGLTREMGYEFDRSRITNFSDANLDRELDLIKVYYEKAFTFPLEDLDKKERLDLAIFQLFLKNIIDGDEFRYHGYLITHLYGIHYELLNLMTENHSIYSRIDAEDYLSRLEQFPERFDQLFVGLSISRKKNILPPRIIIEKSRDILQEFISPPVEKNIYYTYFGESVNNLPEIDSFGKTELKKRALDLTESTVYSSHKRFISYLDDILPEADNNAGVWKLPEGDRYYEYCLKIHTTTDPRIRNTTPIPIGKFSR